MFDLVISFSLEDIGRGSVRPALAGLIERFDGPVLTLLPATLKASRGRHAIAEHDEIAKTVEAAPDGSFSLLFKRDKRAFLDGVAGDAHSSLNAGCGSDSPLLTNDPFAGANAMLADFARAYGSRCRIGGYAGLSIRNLPYERARPPRDYLVVGQSNLVDVIDARVGTKGETGAAIQAIVQADLPTGARRTTVGEIAIIDWSGGAKAAESERIAECLASRDRWLAAQQIGRPAEGWTEAGDVIADPVGAQPHEGLTLYSPPLGVGYVAIHSGIPNAERREILERAARLAKAGRTDAGATLSQLILIADSREAAKTLRAEAGKLGLTHVFYATDDHLLDPFPEGDWADAPGATA